MVLNINVIVWLFVVIILLPSLSHEVSGSQLGGSLALQGTFGNVWRHFWLPRLGGATGIKRVEVRDAAQYFYNIHYTPQPEDTLSSLKC